MSCQLFFGWPKPRFSWELRRELIESLVEQWSFRFLRLRQIAPARTGPAERARISIRARCLAVASGGAELVRRQSHPGKPFLRSTQNARDDCPGNLKRARDFRRRVRPFTAQPIAQAHHLLLQRLQTSQHLRDLFCRPSHLVSEYTARHPATPPIPPPPSPSVRQNLRSLGRFDLPVARRHGINSGDYESAHKCLPYFVQSDSRSIAPYRRPWRSRVCP